MTRLDEIPTAFAPPPGARPSGIVAHIRSIRPSRRTVLRGLVIGAAAAALVPMDWFLARREAAAQGSDSGPASKSEHLTCAPQSYTEEANNWPEGTGPAVCYGGFRRGGYPCADGYHREGTYGGGEETYESTRLTTNCHGKNAWRWNGWRCSDATTTFTFPDGTEYNGITIAACALPETEAAPPAPADDSGDSGSGDDTGSDDTGGDDTGSDDTGSDDTGSDGNDTGSDRNDDDSGDGDSDDPSRPRRVIPGLGVRSLPGIGQLAGR